MTASRVVVELARADLRTPVIDPGHPEYDRLRRVYNGTIDRRPSAIVQARTTSDVETVVRIAADAGLPLAIRCGGHSFAGLGTCDDGIVCDLSRIDRVEIDPAARVASVGGGALLGDVDAAGASFGLVTPAGVVSHTGVGGLTLGGGMGYLSRRFGLTIDSLLEAEIVTADGCRSRVSAVEQPHLFWAIRGGGGNFGVVTQFTFRLHELGPVAVRRWAHPVGRTRETLRRYRDAAATAPRELTTAFIVSDEELSLRAIQSGPTVRSRLLVDRFALPGGVQDAKLDMTFLDLQRLSDELLPWGRRYYSKGGFIAEIDDQVIDVIADSVAEMPMGGLEVYCLQLGGAVTDVPEAATAYAGRAGQFYWIAQGVWDLESDDDRAVAWCRATARRLGALSLQANYVNEQADTGIAQSAYGDTKYRRLATLKAQYDPTNLFRLNQNIVPIPTTGPDPAAY